MNKINSVGKVAISILAVLVLGFAMPIALAQGNAEFNNAPGDMPTLQVADHTLYAGSNSNWSTSVTANPSDELSFMVYYHNTSDVTAYNTTVEISLPATVSNGTNVSATVSASNASFVQGDSTIYFTNGVNGYNADVPLTYIQGSATWYDDGSSNPTPWPYGEDGDNVVSSNGGVSLGDIPAGDYGYVVIHAQLGGLSNGNTVNSVANTEAAINVSNSSATLVGSIYPNGYDTTAYFEYGVDTSLGSYTTSQDIGSSYVNGFAANISDLNSGTTYYYRVVAQNSSGIYYGSIFSFTTPNYYTSYYTPTYTTVYTNGYSNPVPTNYYSNSVPNYTESTEVGNGNTSAVVSGAAYPNGNDSEAYFQYGTTPSFGYTTASQNVGSSDGSVPVSATLTGLQPNTTYYYRLVVTNPYGTGYGSTQTLTTSGNSVVNTNTNTVTTNTGTDYTTLSSILTSMNRILTAIENENTSNSNTSYTQPNQTQTTVAANVPATQSITISGSISPNGADTKGWFEYGTTNSFGYNSPAQDVGSGNGTVPISATLTGLQPNTTYYYRAVAQNVNGTGYGSTLTFTTGNGSNGNGIAATNSSNSSNSYTASIFSALGGSWVLIGLVILVLIAIGVILFVRFILV